MFGEHLRMNRLIHSMFQLSLIVASIFVLLGGSSALICHCLNMISCDPVNYNCPNGCANGWYGPGCQIGNIALNKPAFQSSTYASFVAENAVNGLMPPEGDVTEDQCSHTAQSNTEDHWWYVNLSDTEDFIIKNITIVNRQGINGQSLRKFYILYTNNLTSEPDPQSWKQCAFIGPFQGTTVATYTCETGTAIARRVAVYLVAGPITNSNVRLILCEVYVDGYSYDATSILEHISNTVTPTCDDSSIQFSTLPIVPPTRFVVQLRESSSVLTNITKIQNTMSGLRTLTVSSLANRTYFVSVIPEICCIGSQCLENFTLETSKCVSGTGSVPVMVTTPRYRQYALQKVGKLISMTALNNETCFSTNKTVQCNELLTGDTSTANCSGSSSCILDPRFNYTCSLTVLFSDGFTQTTLQRFKVTTADFSAVKIASTSSCNSVTITLENTTARWDLAPSIIEFYMATDGGNETQVARVVANETGQIKVHFVASSNSNYTAWAIPQTYLSNNNLSDMIEKICNDSINCMTGLRTSVIDITTAQRKYILETEGCCASFSDVSPEDCEKPESYKINCASDEQIYITVAKQNGLLFCLKPMTSYSCSYTAKLYSGQIEIYSHLLETFNLSSCQLTDKQSEQSSSSQSTAAAIGGSLSGLLLLIGVLALVLILQKRQRTLANRTNAVTKIDVDGRNSDLQSGADVLPLQQTDCSYESLTITTITGSHEDYAVLQ